MRKEKRDVTVDQLWKILIEDFFKEAIEFFAPEIVELIDFTKEYVLLNKELGRIDKKRMYADSLVKVHWKDKIQRWLLIHIEVQSYDDKVFAERMFRYYCLIYFNYQKEIFPIAIYTNEDKKYMPSEYKNELFNTGVKYKYKTYKIIEQDEEQLKKSDNIFSLIVLASLYTLKAKNDNIRADFKRELIKILKQKKYDKDKRYKLFYFLECIIKIEDADYSEVIKEELMKEIKGGEREMDITWDDVVRSSPFFKITLKQEKEKVKEEAIKEGREEGERKGIKKGVKEGKKEGVKEVAKRMLKQGYSMNEISKITEISESELSKINFKEV